MFRLYKQRNFSALINDTFGFIREYGKNYFANYLIVNGGLLLILLVLMYLVGNVFMETLFSGFGSTSGEKVIEQYFNDNAGLFLSVMIISFILIALLTLLSYSYPVIYMKILEQGKVPVTKEIVSAMWKKAGRIIIFALLWLVTFLPIIIIASLIALALIVIIIGIPFAVILFAGVTAWMYLAFFEYLNNNKGYFSAMKSGLSILFQNFWPHVGSTAIIYIIVTILHSIISFIPYVIGMASFFSGFEENGTLAPDKQDFSFLALMMLITFILSIVLSFLLGNVIFINQGMIYYSAREENESMSVRSEIDLIGSDGE